MKPIAYNITIILFTILLSFIFPQNIHAQCGNITVTIKKEDSPCLHYGKIEAIVTGKDIDNGKFTSIQYRFVNPDLTKPQPWQNENYLHELVPGTYHIHIRGICKDAGGQVVERLDVVPPVTIGDSGWKSMTLKVDATQHAFECYNEGKVTFSEAVGGTGPYTLKMTAHPAEYTGIKQKTFAKVSSVNGSTWDNLAPGTYIFELTESSICGAKATTTSVTIKKLTLASMPDLFDRYYVYQILGSNIANQNDSYYTKSMVASRAGSFYNDYYNYMYFSSKYLEYAITYPEDGTPNPSDPNLTWTTLPDYATYVRLNNLRYNMDEMQDDQGHKKPDLYVRVKGCPTIARVFPVYMDFSSRINFVKNGCDNYLQVKIYYLSYPICYPITWELQKKKSNGTYDVVEKSSGPISYKNAPGTLNFPNQNTQGTYRFKTKSACGKEYFSRDYLFTYTYPADLVSTFIYSFGCSNNYIAPCFYLDEGNRFKDIEYIKFIKVQKSIQGQSWQDITSSDPDYIEPDIKEWRKDKITPSVLQNQYLVCLWATSLDNTMVSNTSQQTLEAKGNLIKIPRKQIRYRLFFDIKDVCGNVRNDVTLLIGSNGYYDYVDTPKFEKKYDCYNGYDVSIPNINKLIKYYRRDANNSNFSAAYARIVSAPAGSVPGRDYSTGYTSWTDQPLNIRKAGDYKIKISYYNYLADSCSMIYNFTMPDFNTSLDLDANLTAAYRCQNSLVGDGYIKIALRNASQDLTKHYYTLFQLDSLTGLYDSITTNITGEFSGWSHKPSDGYKIRVVDAGCPTVREFQQEISVVDLGAVPIAWTNNNNVCPGGTIKISALALGVEDDKYKWSFSGDPNWSATGKDIIIPNAGTQHSGTYTVHVIPVYCNNEMTGSVNISVGIAELYWSPDAVDGNWFEKTNWLNADGSSAEGYPSPCTTVHIPGNADHYPNLSSDHYPWINNARPVCDTIIYHYGGETAYPSELSYNIAKIQYNWSYYSDNPVSQSQPTLNQDSHYPGNGTRALPRLLRGSWQMLSAPLKYMTAGDFSLAGKPNTFQRLYNYQDADKQITPGPAGATYPFAQYNLDLSNLCSAVAIAVAPYKSDHTGAQDQSNLQALHGIIEIPYFYNPTQSASHPLHKYNEATQESTFTRYDVETLQPIPSQTDKITRDKQAYRFVYEQSDNTPVTILDGSENIAIYEMPLIKPATGNKIMIGNPLMSHIDFDKLYALNTQGGNDIIEDNYEIIETATGNTLTYQIGATHNTASQYIAPLQAIIIKLKNPNKTQKLRFNLTGSKSVVAYGNSDTDLPKPKTINMNISPQSWVHIQTHIKDGVTRKTNTDAIRLLIGNTISGNDKIKTPQNEDLSKRANIFLIDSHGTWYQELNTPIPRQTTRYPLGILTTLTGEITLEITPGGHYTKIQLEDKHLHKTIDVTKGGQYTFYHRVNLFTGRQGMDISRFQLKVTP